MKLLACIKEDSIKIFHVLILTSYDLKSRDVITQLVS